MRLSGPSTKLTDALALLLRTPHLGEITIYQADPEKTPHVAMLQGGT
eukprot:CAMPEP_0168418222 /NCGR_PEP_ID=MMETSP0228-20121227/31656_1 /TAXON_ID=133427 /ORGANISM="Protoceratium reticulatum, Strain CCCM 535 (=CCMP 1889)" /LENGTH=46 /DNA_ID= /DNA_START= /DNA_END= /DNA_ORIENTATION=